MPEFKEYLSYLNRLYEEGLIEKTFPANKGSLVREKLSAGTAGVATQSTWSLNRVDDSLKNINPDATWDYIGLISNNGVKGTRVDVSFTHFSFLPKASPNPEHAMKWINAKLEPETFKLLCLGIEGEHHTVAGDDFEPILPNFLNEIGEAPYYLNGTRESVWAKYWMVRTKKDPRMHFGFRRILDFSADGPVYDVAQVATALPLYSRKRSELGQIEVNFATNVVAGTKSLNEYDAFLREWRAAGGDDVTKEINDYYAANPGMMPKY